MSKEKTIEEQGRDFIEKFFIHKISDGTPVPPENCYEVKELQRQTDMVVFLTKALQERDRIATERTIRIMQHQAHNNLKTAKAVAEWGDAYLQTK